MTAIALPRYPSIDEMLQDFLRSGATGYGNESRSVSNQTQEQSKEVRRSLSLVRTAGSVQKLRDLQEGWDGRDAEPPSKLLIAHAEAFWQAIDHNVPSRLMRPSIRMSRDGYVSFSWIKPKENRELHIWFHDGDEITYEVHLRTPKITTDKKKAPLEDVIEALKNFYRQS